MIPTILHQIFIGNNTLKNLPKSWQRYTTHTRKLHKSWTYMQWDNPALIDLTRTHYPDFVQYFASDIPVVLKADIGRYLILKHYGGWYFDYDYELLQALDSWNTHPAVFPLECSLEDDFADTTREKKENRIGNAILATIPQHFFWDKMLSTLPPASDLHKDSSAEYILSITGPNKVSAVYNALSPEAQAQIFLADRYYFHHPVPQLMTVKQYKKLKDDTKIYGLHHTHSSWRDIDMHKNIRRRQMAGNRIMRPLMLLYAKCKSIFIKSG